MAICATCNAEVEDDKMEAHVSEAHADTAPAEAPAEGGNMAAEAPAEEAAPAAEESPAEEAAPAAEEAPEAAAE